VNLFFGVHEVRLFRPAGVAVGYFTDWESALRSVENEPTPYRACYFSLNPVKLPTGIPTNPTTLRPSANAVGASDIEKRVWLLIDCDPPRPVKSNSTSEEKQAARDQAQRIREWLRSHGWPEPVLADSGNGWHLLYRIDLPNDEASKCLVQRFLSTLKQRFPMTDAGNFDAPRLAKLYGSWARKGEHSEERPWRRSAIVEEGSGEIVTETQLRSLAPMQDPAPQTAATMTDGDRDRLLGFLDCYAVPVRSEAREVTGGWQVEVECPWSAEHSDETRRDTVVSFIAGRGYGFKCFHSHCVQRRWREFRAELERRHPDKRFSFVSDEAAGAVTIGGAEKPRRKAPVYPTEVWDGTAVGEFAKLCAHDNNIPRKLYAESFRTVLGAIVGNQLSCPAVEGAIPRSYTIIIAPFGKGKGTAIRRATRFFSQPWCGTRTTSGLTVQGNTPGFLSGCREFIWKPQGIGAWNASASSVPGMAKLARDTEETLEKRPQLAWGSTLPRILSVHEEMKTFFSTIYIDGGVGVGVDGVICQLWDDVEFNGTATGTRDALYGQMMFSILGGVTPDDWFDLISKGNAVGGGLMSRLNLIGTEGKYENVPKMTPPNFTLLQDSFIPRIKLLADVPAQIHADEGAERVIAEWADTVPEGSERLNVQVWRSALLLAWLRREERISASVAEEAVRLGQYQAASQEFYRVAAADNPVAKAQAKIERALEMKGPMSRRGLQQSTNARRIGTTMWNAALDGLVKDQQVGLKDGLYFVTE